MGTAQGQGLAESSPGSSQQNKKQIAQLVCQDREAAGKDGAEGAGRGERVIPVAHLGGGGI